LRPPRVKEVPAGTRKDVIKLRKYVKRGQING